MRERDTIQDKIQAVLTRLKTEKCSTAPTPAGGAGSPPCDTQIQASHITTGSPTAQQQSLSATVRPWTETGESAGISPGRALLSSNTNGQVSGIGNVADVACGSTTHRSGSSGVQDTCSGNGLAPFQESTSPSLVQQSALSKASAPWRERLVSRLMLRCLVGRLGVAFTLLVSCCMARKQVAESVVSQLQANVDQPTRHANLHKV